MDQEEKLHVHMLIYLKKYGPLINNNQTNRNKLI
jgi:hypothetical protein